MTFGGAGESSELPLLSPEGGMIFRGKGLTMSRAVDGGGESSELPLLGPEGGMIFGGKIFPTTSRAVYRGDQSPELPLLGPEGGMILRGKILPTTSSFVDWSDESLGILGLENMEVQLTREWWVWVRDCNGWEYTSKEGRASATVVRSIVASSTSTVAAGRSRWCCGLGQGVLAASHGFFFLGDLCVGEYNVGRGFGPIYYYGRAVCLALIYGLLHFVSVC